MTDNIAHDTTGGGGMRMRDTFAGAGGWSVAAVRRLGWTEDGAENMPAARATREAEGLSTPVEDVSKIEPVPGEYDVDASGPPCQTFSATGGRTGARALHHVLAGVQSYREGRPQRYDRLTATMGDERTALVLEPLRIALGARTTYLAWEQVPEVLPVWQACAVVLREQGWDVAVGLVYAEQYEVPQTRRRAVLLARRDGRPVHLPTPTRARYGDLTSPLPPPVTLGEALWLPDGTRLVSNYGTGGDARRRGFRTADQPAATVTSKADRVKVHLPDGTVRNLTLDEAAALQTFPPGYRFQGTKSERGLQIGNAIPVKLALALLRAVTD